MQEQLRKLAASIHRNDPTASFSFVLWDGEVIQYGEQPKATLHIHSQEAVRDMFRTGFLGFGNAYISRKLEVVGDLQELVRLGLLVKFDEIGYGFLQKLRFLPLYLKTPNTIGQSRRNISSHYDLPQEFYPLFLDKNQTYSCAYFKNAEDSLEEAQANKYEHIARKLMLQEGDTLVDVGCGWGGMLVHSALNFGVRVLGITLSTNQHQFVSQKLRDLGITGRAEVKLLDYRRLSGQFDKFVSIGMFEHVGKKFIAVYLKKVANLLKKGGLGLLHTISKDVESPTDAWIRQNIFPGGYIPSLPEIIRAMGRAGFFILDIEGLRMHYARTLDCWIANFERNIEQVQKMFDERFIRMWRLYLNACSAGFKYNGTRVYQILFSNGPNNDWPICRDHMYSNAHGEPHQTSA